MHFVNKHTGKLININPKFAGVVAELLRHPGYRLANDADFKENEHPRDPSGKFTSGGGSAKATEMTTAQLRNKGHEAAQNRDYKQAAEMYREAIKNYPTHNEGSQLAKEDLKKLEGLANRYEGMAKESEPKAEPKASVGRLSKKSGEPKKSKGYIDKHGFERQAGLSPKERRIESNFYKMIRENESGLVADYKKEFGNVIDPDMVKKLYPAFRKDSSLATAVHEPSSYLSKVIWKNALKDKKEAGDKSPVIFTAGGSGSGKSEAGDLAKKLINAPEDALTFDSVLGNYDKSVKKIDEALNGQDGPIDIVYTNATLELATKLNMQRQRTVRLGTMIEAHRNASNNIRKLQEHYKNDPRVNITVINNNGDPPDLSHGSMDDVPDYNDEKTTRDRAIKEAERLVAGKLLVHHGKTIENQDERLKLFMA